MKKVEKSAEGKNFAAVNIGKSADLGEYDFVIAPGVEVPGKVFVGKALQCTGCEVSFQTMPPAAGVEFLHTHIDNEELYIVIKGTGEYQVDGHIFPATEGSVIRVAPAGKRTWRNTGTESMVMLCIQSKSNSLKDLGIADGVIVREPVIW